jgi:hypothetical protein
MVFFGATCHSAFHTRGGPRAAESECMVFLLVVMGRLSCAQIPAYEDLLRLSTVRRLHLRRSVLRYLPVFTGVYRTSPELTGVHRSLPACTRVFAKGWKGRGLTAGRAAEDRQGR